MAGQLGIDFDFQPVRPKEGDWCEGFWVEESTIGEFGDMDSECGECIPGHGGDEPERVSTKKDGHIKKILDPRLPTQSEVDEHNLTHLPYRNWCPICVQAKGKDMDHRSAVDRERGLSEYCFDYCFPGDELGYKWSVLVGRERNSGMQFATAVPTKGSSGKFSVDKVLEYIEEAGDSNNSIIVKNDQEVSIQFY